MSGSFAEVRRSLGKVCGGLDDVCGSLGKVCCSLGKVVDCEFYINFKDIRFKNSENHVGRNLIFVKSMKNNMLRNLV